MDLRFILSCALIYPFKKDIHIFTETAVNQKGLFMIEEFKRKRGGNYSKVIMENGFAGMHSMPLASEPMTIFKNSHNLKIELFYKEKIKMKVLDGTGLPLYLRKLNPVDAKEILINISDWEDGKYTIVFTDNSSNLTIASGEFSIG